MVPLKPHEWATLVGLLILSLVPCLGGVLRLLELSHFIQLEFLPDNPRIASAPLPVVIHLSASIPYCVLGAFQFLASFRKAYPKWHRMSGGLLAVSGIVSAASGLWMTFSYSFPEELQGHLLFIVRIVVGLAMMLFLFLACYAVYRKHFSQHRAFMIRAYALGQGAGTQFLISIPWLATVGEPSGFPRDVLMTVAWLMNIAVAEWVIRSPLRKSQCRS